MRSRKPNAERYCSPRSQITFRVPAGDPLPDQHTFSDRWRPSAGDPSLTTRTIRSRRRPGTSRQPIDNSGEQSLSASRLDHRRGAREVEGTHEEDTAVGIANGAWFPGVEGYPQGAVGIGEHRFPSWP
jgi:hypothetical protein